MNKPETDWVFFPTDQFWTKKITYRDIPDDNTIARYDSIKEGYWIRNDSKLATVLALKGCRWTRKFGQDNW